MFLLFSIVPPKWKQFTALTANHSSQENFKSIKKLLLAECFHFQRWKFGWVWKHTQLEESTSIIHRLHQGRRDTLIWWYNAMLRGFIYNWCEHWTMNIYEGTSSAKWTHSVLSSRQKSSHWRCSVCICSSCCPDQMKQSIKSSKNCFVQEGKFAQILQIFRNTSPGRCGQMMHVFT